MSKRDMQRRTIQASPAGVQAQYWNGFITRTEAQKVYDEQLTVIQAQALAIQKLDTVITYLMQVKLGVTIEEVNNYVKELAEKLKAEQEAQAAAQAAQTGQGQANSAVPEQANGVAPEAESPLVVA